MLRSADFRNSIRTKGRKITDVVVLLPDDSVGYMYERLAETGGQAAVVVGEETGSYVMLAEVGARSSASDHEIVDLAPDTSAAMLVQYVRLLPGRTVHFCVRQADSVRFELIDEGPLCETAHQ
jgi:hypothetical protein